MSPPTPASKVHDVIGPVTVPVSDSLQSPTVTREDLLARSPTSLIPTPMSQTSSGSSLSLQSWFNSGGDEDKALTTAKLTLDVEMAVARTASPRVTDVAPILQLPPFRALLTDEEDKHLDIDNGSPTSDEHTKKSFDFTGKSKTQRIGWF